MTEKGPESADWWRGFIIGLVLGVVSMPSLIETLRLTHVCGSK